MSKKCKIDLSQNIEEQVTDCVNQIDIGTSPSASKLYTCKSSCEFELNQPKQSKFIRLIIKKLTDLKEQDECDIEVSVGPAPEQAKKKTPIKQPGQ